MYQNNFRCCMYPVIGCGGEFPKFPLPWHTVFIFSAFTGLVAHLIIVWLKFIDIIKGICRCVYCVFTPVTQCTYFDHSCNYRCLVSACNVWYTESAKNSDWIHNFSSRVLRCCKHRVATHLEKSRHLTLVREKSSKSRFACIAYCHTVAIVTKT